MLILTLFSKFEKETKKVQIMRLLAMSSPLFLVYYKFTPVILTYHQVIINNFTPLTILLFFFVIQI
jgi:hypothetical protein